METSGNESASPAKPQTEPVDYPPRVSSPEPEPQSFSEPVEFSDKHSVSAGEVSVQEVLLEVTKKKKRSKKPKKKPSPPTKKTPSFTTGNVSEGKHRPLPPSAQPRKGILKKKK